MQLKSSFLLLCPVLWILSSCGYQFTSSTFEGEQVTLSIPYIQGDPKAQLNNELVKAFASSGRFHCMQSGGDFFLQVELLSDSNDRIGYRYDRDTSSGKRLQNILAVENRRNLIAKVTLYDSHSGDVIFGPWPVKASADYDYADPGSPRDLDTITPYGPFPSIRYSYGQLNTVEGAHDDSSVNLYGKLSQTIVQSIVNQLFK